jgi:hypothetical protein
MEGRNEMTNSRAVRVVGTILLLAAVAYGQSSLTSNQTVSVQNQTTTNQCSTAGEPVTLNGTLQIQLGVTQDADGTNHFSLSVKSDLNGVGQSSGSIYLASDSSEYQVNTTDTSAQMDAEVKSDLVQQGGEITLQLVQSLRINVDTSGAISGQVLQSTTKCGN